MLAQINMFVSVLKRIMKFVPQMDLMDMVIVGNGMLMNVGHLDLAVL